MFDARRAPVVSIARLSSAFTDSAGPLGTVMTLFSSDTRSFNIGSWALMVNALFAIVAMVPVQKRQVFGLAQL